MVGGWRLGVAHSSFLREPENKIKMFSIQKGSETNPQPSTPNPPPRVFLPKGNSRANLSSNLDGTTHQVGVE